MKPPTFSYALHPDEKLSHGFFRILGEICGEAKNLTLAREPMSERIHAARLLIKRMRALLWLVRPALDERTFAKAKVSLRKAAQLLSSQRDATVMLTTLEKIALKTSKLEESLAVAATLKLLEAQQTVLEKKENSRKSKLDRAMKTPGELANLIKRSTAKSAKWPAASVRVEKAYRIARQAERKALRSGKDIDLHEWRKKVKRLLYALELTRTESDKRKCRATAYADKLQEKLGSHQDCVVVEQHLARSSALPAPARTVASLIRKRKKHLREKSRKIARRLDKDFRSGRG